MLEWIASSCALILAVLLLRRLLRGRIGPGLQYALWLLVLARLLLPVSFGAARVSVQNLVRDADERAASRVVTYVNQTAPDRSPLSQPRLRAPRRSRSIRKAPPLRSRSRRRS